MENYKEWYNREMLPWFKKIDLFIKTSEQGSFDTGEVAELLELSPEELADVMAYNEIYRITPVNFFDIMQSGSSEVCGFFRREVQVGSPEKYSPEEIAYIYKLDLSEIKKAARELNLQRAGVWDLPKIFERIEIYTQGLKRG